MTKQELEEIKAKLKVAPDDPLFDDGVMRFSAEAFYRSALIDIPKLIARVEELEKENEELREKLAALKYNPTTPLK